MSDEILAQVARTRRFRLGVPRDVTISPDGGRVLFLRAASGEDPVTSLWLFDVDSGDERLLADGAALAGGELSAAERAYRERARESAEGIVGYATDADLGRVVFTVDGALWTATVDGARPVRLPAAGSAVDPRLAPDGRQVAYVSAGALRLVGADGTGDRALAEPETADVTYGLAEHVAAESMHRLRGHWWSPDSTRLLVSRVDTAAVRRWYISDPADPTRPPAERRYPSAGTTNADVSLWCYPVGSGDRVEIRWDRDTFEYLAAVTWAGDAPLLLVQSRDQRDVQVLRADPATGDTELVHADHDDAWWELVPGLPAYTGSGDLVWTVDDGDTRRLTVGGKPVTPPGLQVRDISTVDGDAVLFRASTDPTETHVYRWRPDTGPLCLTEDTPGLHSGQSAGGTLVLTSHTMPGVRVTVDRNGHPPREIRSLASTPVLRPRVTLHSFGERALRTAVLLPTGFQRGSGRLPVLLDPYGGPGMQLAVAASAFYLTSQWFADQGYAVLVTDGRGTPGRGPRWEKTIHHDKLSFALQDQIDALHAAADEYPELDLSRVVIRGWSYGGYLAAAAVLRRPDVFRAAAAGAPVTDPLLYDSHWQERFLGHPTEHPDVYHRNSLIPDAPRLSRPLLLIHGLADDNVYVAHTLRLSAALLAAGRPHTVLPLTGITHMAAREDVAVNVPKLELEFLNRALND
jgi:dipeptidyl-peptidase 4